VHLRFCRRNTPAVSTGWLKQQAWWIGATWDQLSACMQPLLLQERMKGAAGAATAGQLIVVHMHLQEGKGGLHLHHACYRECWPRGHVRYRACATLQPDTTRAGAESMSFAWLVCWRVCHNFEHCCAFRGAAGDAVSTSRHCRFCPSAPQRLLHPCEVNVEASMATAPSIAQTANSSTANSLAVSCDDPQGG
jgi:hypothetical protein